MGVEAIELTLTIKWNQFLAEHFVNGLGYGGYGMELNQFTFRQLDLFHDPDGQLLILCVRPFLPQNVKPNLT